MCHQHKTPTTTRQRTVNQTTQSHTGVTVYVDSRLTVAGTHRRRALTKVIVHKREATKLILGNVVDDRRVNGRHRRLLRSKLPVKI